MPMTTVATVARSARDLVHDCYAAGRRPSLDPVVFFKLQLDTVGKS
jgi:hypothetical protein